MSNVYDAIAKEITALMDNGIVPWRRPWTVKGEGPVNIASGKTYRGGNWFTLGMKAHFNGYGSNVWGTYRQIQAAGGQVRKGEKSTPCVWFSAVPVKDSDGQPVLRDGEPVHRSAARLFRVFNACQCDGLDHLLEAPGDATNRPAREIFEAMPHRPTVNHGGDRAFYRPGDDTVTVPNPSRFDGEPHYWAAMFHELAHATGHESRLGRLEARGWDARRDSEAYSEEELVAEFASSFLCGTAGIECQTIENSAAYIAGWRRQITSKPQTVARAISHAAKAADCILGR